MILIIIIVWLVLWSAFVYMAHKLPDKFGWWCIGIMIALIIYLPVTIAISKINKSCPQINWEQKYNDLVANCELNRGMEERKHNEEIAQKEKVFKKYPRVRKYFNAR